MSEEPGLIKTEEIVRGLSDVPVQKKLKILFMRGTLRSPFYVRRKFYGTEIMFYKRSIFQGKFIICKNVGCRSYNQTIKKNASVFED